MTKPDWYRSLKGYKYATNVRRTCKAEGLPDFTHEFFGCCEGELYAKPHYAWDGASGPTFDTPMVMSPSLFHDISCQAISEGLLDREYRKYADDLFKQHLLTEVALYALTLKGLKKKLYMAWGKTRASYYHAGVRLYSKWKGM